MTWRMRCQYVVAVVAVSGRRAPHSYDEATPLVTAACEAYQDAVAFHRELNR